jgi:hypothetical protein
VTWLAEGRFLGKRYPRPHAHSNIELSAIRLLCKPTLVPRHFIKHVTHEHSNSPSSLMSEPYIHTDLPSAGSGPIFIFHGDVHGFTYSANPQGDLVSCMMVNPATSTSPSGKLEDSLLVFNYFSKHDFVGSTPWSESLRQDRTT